MPFLWFFTCLFHGSLHALFSYKGSLQALGFFTCLFMVLYRPFLGFLQVLFRVLYRPFQCSLHALFRFFTGLFQLWFFTHSYSASVLFNTGRFVIFMGFFMVFIANSFRIRSIPSNRRFFIFSTPFLSY